MFPPVAGPGWSAASSLIGRWTTVSGVSFSFDALSSGSGSPCWNLKSLPAYIWLLITLSIACMASTLLRVRLNGSMFEPIMNCYAWAELPGATWYPRRMVSGCKSGGLVAVSGLLIMGSLLVLSCRFCEYRCMSV